MLHQSTLLLGRLGHHKSHRWPTNRLTARFCVNRIVLVALDVSLHVLRRHQTHLMTKLPQLACPIVRRGAGFHPNQAWRQRFEKRYHLTAAKLFPDHDLLGRIDAVNLENVLRDIQTDRDNLHVDRCDLSEAFRASLRPADLDPSGAAIGPTEFVQPLYERGNPLALM